MIGSSKNSTENYPRKCFWAQEKETWIKFNPGLSANRPSNNRCFKCRECSLSVIALKSLHQKAFKPRKKTEDAPRNVWFSFRRAFWKILTISRLILIYKFCISLHWFLSLSLTGAHSSHTHRPDFPNFLSVSNILNLAYHHEKRPYLHICKPVAAGTPEIWSFFRPVKKCKKKHWLSVDWLSYDLEFYPYLKCHRYKKFVRALLVQILCHQLYLKFSKNVRLLTKSSWFWKCW